jgi:hypothetical protein
MYAHLLNEDRNTYQASYLTLTLLSCVKTLWGTLNNMPFPRQAIRLKESRQDIEGLSLFREGYKPSWEAFTAGGVFEMLLTTERATVHTVWETAVLDLVGNTLPADLVGLRVVCKPRPSLTFKLEAWVCAACPSVGEWLERVCLSVDHRPIRFTSFVDKMTPTLPLRHCRR